MKNNGSSKNTTPRKYGAVLAGFLAGILGGVLTWLATDMIAPHQVCKTYCYLSVDTADFRQGIGSLRWDVTIQPRRKYLFSGTKMIGVFLHFEVMGDKVGKVEGLNLNDIKGLKFYAKASHERFHVTEVNLFVGNNYLQYMFSRQDGLVMDTKWREYFIPLTAFYLAPWERKFRFHLVSNRQPNKTPDISDVTAFGFDLKTTRNPISGKIWIDYIRFVNRDGEEILFSDADKKDLIFQNKHVKWMSDWRVYH